MSRILSGNYRFQVSEYRQKEMALDDARPAKFSCAFCGWSFEGTVAKGREKALAHRTKKHPETFDLPRRRRRSGRTLTTFRYSTMDDESVKEILDERRKRAFLNGVEISDGQTE